MHTSAKMRAKTNSSLYRWLGALVFLMVAVIGLYLVKWNPYYHKAFIAIQKHSIGASIISGKTNAAPTPSWNAAWQYSVSYYQAIWQALVVGVVLGSLIQIIVPKDWIIRLLGNRTFSGTAIAGLAALPGMM
ncbi:hypothetical protein LSG31_15605 [Fodinisporobacter ferrooxydans]|uniref:Permease n=1 Tax=Fodinisporobacter ferrooxydans TaxID=2901836 RepID=A0ABY4CFY0_9BACL|nr:hypothetical protein LSG31_15605 [Alicyclobacillaceae bacterium MYW30-H2]